MSISAAALGLGGAARAAPVHQWRGVALGAEVTITLAHPAAEPVARRAMAQIARLEDIFSLYRPLSALSRLNAEGMLDTPPFELLDCLSLCSGLHAASDGAFDPTVQPLWALFADRYAAGAAPDKAEIADVRRLVGFSGVHFDAQRISFARAGMALTLNGVAQGYIADQVADRLRAEGLTDIVVDTGELRAMGSAPDAVDGGWPVSLRAGGRLIRNAVTLRDRALANSAPMGTVFDAPARVGHIIDPRSGTPVPGKWQLVSVSAPLAAVADGLSTAGCMMTRGALTASLSRFPGARLEYLG